VSARSRVADYARTRSSGPSMAGPKLLDIATERVARSYFVGTPAEAPRGSSPTSKPAPRSSAPSTCAPPPCAPMSKKLPSVECWRSADC
jgi:capsular polysaccharide biosynthesis protein